MREGLAMELGAHSGVFRRMTEEMMIIREYASEMEAIVAQNVLEANNIPSTILRDNAGGMLPVLQVIYPVRIAVRPTDADLALSLLDSDVVPGSEGEPPHAEPGEAPLHTTDKVAGSE